MLDALIPNSIPSFISLPFCFFRSHSHFIIHPFHRQRVLVLPWHSIKPGLEDLPSEIVHDYVVITLLSLVRK